MRKIVVALLLVFGLSAGQALAAQVPKIAVVDLQKAVSECREGIAARDVMLKKADEFNAELKKMGTDLEKVRIELEQGGTKMSKDIRTEKEKQFQKKIRALENRRKEVMEDLKQMEADSLKSLVTRLGGIMGKIGDEDGYSAILDKRVGVFYSSRQIDITALLIKKADEESSRK